MRDDVDVAVHYEQNGPVVTVTIDRPGRRNAIDRATADELEEAWRTFDQDDSAAVGILINISRSSAVGPASS